MSTLLSRIFGKKKPAVAAPTDDRLDVRALQPLMSPKDFAEVHAKHAPPGAPAPTPVQTSTPDNPAELTAEWRMDRVLVAFPSAQRVLFQRYHIGGCSSCGYEPGDTLAAVARSHGVEPADIVQCVKDSAEAETSMEISVAETAELLRQGAIKLIDVRTADEYAIARIEGSRLADEALVGEMVQTWPKDTAIVTLCHHGMRSLDAAAYLRGHGLKNTRSMSGGIDAWSQTVDPRVPRY